LAQGQTGSNHAMQALTETFLKKTTKELYKTANMPYNLKIVEQFPHRCSSRRPELSPMVGSDYSSIGATSL
jgi:hypothetical protein